MKKERLEKILSNIVGWASEHDDEFNRVLVDFMDITLEEAKELEMEKYHPDYVGEEE